jgi:hypothetical protein
MKRDDFHWRIETLAQLDVARGKRQAVWCPFPSGYGGLKKPLPAAVVMNMSGKIILRAIISGLIIYTKQNGKT